MKNFIILFLCTSLLFIPSLQIYSDDNNREPAPYEEDEFPEWMQKIRRAEIIFFGSIPITILLSYFTWNFARYGIHDWKYEYRPFGNPNRAEYTQREHIGILITASSISLSIAIIDYIIGKVRERRAGNNVENN